MARVVFRHAYLLADDALFLLHALGGEVGGGDELQERVEVLVEVLGTLEVVGRDEVRGVGVGVGAAGGEDGERVAPGHIEHLVLQEMRHALGQFSTLCPATLKSRMTPP